MSTSKLMSPRPPLSSNKTTTVLNKKKKTTIWRYESLIPMPCACGTSPNSVRNRSGFLPWSNLKLHRTWSSLTGMIPYSQLLIWIRLMKESTISWLRSMVSNLLKSKNRPSTWSMLALKSLKLWSSPTQRRDGSSFHQVFSCQGSTQSWWSTWEWSLPELTLKNSTLMIPSNGRN